MASMALPVLKQNTKRTT